MNLGDQIKYISKKHYSLLVMGILTLMAIQYLIYKDSITLDHVTLFDGDTITISEIQNTDAFYRFHENRSFLELMEHQDGNYLSYKNRNYKGDKDFYNGFGLKGDFSLFKRGELFIRWRVNDLNDKIGIHIIDTPPDSIKDKVGEDYVFLHPPISNEWVVSKVDIKSFEINQWYQPPNVYDDGVFDASRFGTIYFAYIEPNHAISIDIQKIEVRWANDLLIYQLAFGFFIVIGLLLIVRTSTKLIDFKNKKSKSLSYAEHNRFSFLFVSLASLMHMFFITNLEYGNVFILLITIAFILIMIDDLLPDAIHSNRLWSLRYVGLYAFCYFHVIELHPLAYILLLIVLFVPISFRKDRFMILLVGLIFMLMAIFNVNVASESERVFTGFLTLLVTFFMYMHVDRFFFKDNKKSLDNALILYNGIYSHSSDIIYTIDVDGIITSVNKAFTDSVQLQENECVGKNISEFIEKASHKKLGFLYKHKNPRLRRFDVKFCAANNSFYYVYICENPIYIESKLNGYQIIATDITERKKIEEELKKANKKLKSLVNIDGLTQVNNRRYFDKQLDIEIRRASRNNRPLSLIFIDVDYFKPYNDFYGHQAGDECLIKIATTLKVSLQRAADFVARYGGEEFVILLPETDIERAESFAKFIFLSIKELSLPHKKSRVSDLVTVSMGISTLKLLDGKIMNNFDMVEEADKALYIAKESGRNRFCTYKK